MLSVMNRDWFPTMFNDFFDNLDWTPARRTAAPVINVKENAKEYTMEVAAPGIKKEYCRVNIDNDGNLVVSVENKMEHKEENRKERYLRREFTYTNYQQAYQLPANIDRKNIEAKVEDGILTITLPKLTPEKEAQEQHNILIK